jgi:large subunit ribosomal protein L22
MGRSYADTGLVRAQAKWVRSSARKTRLVLEHIRGKSVAEAQTVLAFSPRHVARDIQKVLASATANATNNHGLSEDELVVHAAFADEASTWKRWQPRARGRAMRIRKRTAHITILLRAVAQPVAAAPETVVADEAQPKRRRPAAKPAASAATSTESTDAAAQPDTADATADAAVDAPVADRPSTETETPTPKPAPGRRRAAATTTADEPEGTEPADASAGAPASDDSPEGEEV